jgi:hypothetical protein
MDHRWHSVVDNQAVSCSGTWEKSSFRYSSVECLSTTEDGAELRFQFAGTGLAICLGGHSVPVYGQPNLGKLLVYLDGAFIRTLYPLEESEEVVIAGSLSGQQHELKIIHRIHGQQTGCRIAGFRLLEVNDGEISFTLNGEENSYLVDSRVILSHGNKEVRNVLARNWLTGQCSLTGIPAGDNYSLEVRASGWKTHYIEPIAVAAGHETELPPVYLKREERSGPRHVSFPLMGHPVNRLPGESFRVRLVTYGREILSFKLERRLGEAVISRTLAFIEDRDASFYYEVEGTVTLPRDMPRGLYDLIVETGNTDQPDICRSPQSVNVVKTGLQHPVFMTFGHLDTWGQEQAEYVERMVQLANVLAPDMVLISNEANPAYVSGALSKLQMPYMITFGNHQFGGDAKWFGENVDLIDFGPHICILNFGLPWHTDLSKAHAFMSRRTNTPMKVVNAFEYNAPIEEFLDKHRINLIHDAHGPGRKVMNMGSTPTLRVGKVNSSSFRIIRFQNNTVASCTYMGDKEKPIPFDRFETPPLEVIYKHDATEIANRLNETFPQCRLCFVVPPGQYMPDIGVLESQIASDDGNSCVITVRVDIPALSKMNVRLLLIGDAMHT